MQENYLISIKNRQKLEDETGEIEVTTLGSYVKKGDSRFIVYKEYDTENNAPAQTSVLKVEGDSKVTLMRGAGKTRLVLEKGKRHLCPYDTGYGCMMIGVFTSKVDSRLDDLGGKVEVNYTLDVNASLSSLNEILITVKEAKQQDVKNCVSSNR
ncbi:MAG: DUF1934 domain-containing protein [Clostridiales bacterium]|jgi:uncharacterized beta-barrel protein YwiB (DUF1934 family)|nr:DUF1934 domain-containing protein [Clostridiales bacterium]